MLKNGDQWPDELMFSSNIDLYEGVRLYDFGPLSVGCLSGLRRYSPKNPNVSCVR